MPLPGRYVQDNETHEGYIQQIKCTQNLHLNNKSITTIKYGNDKNSNIFAEVEISVIRRLASRVRLGTSL
jgi:uncharacterized protein (UPF0333 family)